MNISEVPVLILAGGFGTRLRSVVDVPKPVAPIQGRPFLDYTIRSLYKQGARNLILSLYFDPEKVIQAIQSQKYPDDLKISFVTEPNPMGTGGAVRYAYDFLKLTSGAFVCNGDTYFEKGLKEIYSAQSSSIGLLHVPDAARYGRVVVDSEGYIDSFQEKDSVSKPALINMGLYYLTHSFIQSMPAGAHSIEKDVFEKHQGRKILKGIPVETYFIDIGIPDDYHRFEKDAALIN